MSIRIQIDAGEGDSQAIEVPDSTRSLAEALADHGFPLNTRCGHRGLCCGCEVRLREGTLSSAGGESCSAPATVQACRMQLTEPVSIEIPARSRIEHRPQVSETFRIEIPCAHQPLFSSEKDGRDTAFAIDVGTTTVVVLLIDLPSGEILSRASGFNEQIQIGDNVLTRIEAANSRDGGCEEMQSQIVTQTIVPLLERACERAERPLSRIAGGAIAGNTTMLHLLIGEDPASLGVAPFTPVFIEARALTAGDLNLPPLAPETPIHLLPGIAAYVGADIVAGVYATGMVYDTAPSLLVDIGTNGEVILQKDGKLFACATAAGPAFEGSGLCCGSRAREGAVSDLRIEADPFRVEADLIGDIPAARAAGICGSAYIDFMAQGRLSEFLTPSGRFDLDAWERLPEKLRIEKDGERALRIAGEQHISEVDVALLLQAKAAIGAGIETLLDVAGLEAAQIDRVYLAGGFGMHLNVAHAIAIDLLPGFHEENIRVVGNTALAGALLAILDRTTIAEMDALRSQVEVIELNLQEDFADRFVDHLMLP